MVVGESEDLSLPCCNAELFSVVRIVVVSERLQFNYSGLVLAIIALWS